MLFELRNSYEIFDTPLAIKVRSRPDCCNNKDVIYQFCILHNVLYIVSVDECNASYWFHHSNHNNWNSLYIDWNFPLQECAGGTENDWVSCNMLQRHHKRNVANNKQNCEYSYRSYLFVLHNYVAGWLPWGSLILQKWCFSARGKCQKGTTLIDHCVLCRTFWIPVRHFTFRSVKFVHIHLHIHLHIRLHIQKG